MSKYPALKILILTSMLLTISGCRVPVTAPRYSSTLSPNPSDATNPNNPPNLNTEEAQLPERQADQEVAPASSSPYTLSLSTLGTEDNSLMGLGTGWQTYSVGITVMNTSGQLIELTRANPIVFEDDDYINDVRRGAPYDGESGAYVQTDTNVNYPVDFLVFSSSNFTVVGNWFVDGLVLPSGYNVKQWGYCIYGLGAECGITPIAAVFAIPDKMVPTMMTIPGYPSFNLRSVPTEDQIPLMDSQVDAFQQLPQTFTVNDTIQVTINPFRLEYREIAIPNGFHGQEWLLVGDISYTNLDSTSNHPVPDLNVSLLTGDGVAWFDTVVDSKNGDYCHRLSSQDSIGPSQTLSGEICPGMLGDFSAQDYPYYLAVGLDSFKGSFMGVAASLSTPSQDSTMDLTVDILQQLLEQAWLPDHPEVHDLQANTVEQCGSITDAARAKGIEVAWSVSYGWWEPCTGTQFCTDGQRPTSTIDTVYLADGSYHLEGKSFSEICVK